MRHLETDDSEYQQEPASVKKMLAGDATWATRKVILGWLVDMAALMIQLPHHHIMHLFEIIDTL
jgi:hypothetical protein